MKTTLLLLLALFACPFASALAEESPSADRPKSIVILHDNDVHCALSGYPVIAGLRNAINASDTASALLVSSGDFLSGGLAGTLSRGSQIVDAMNAARYDVVTIGNHEFDFQLPRMRELMQRLNARVVCANFLDVQKRQWVYPPYAMMQVGKRKVGFVGCDTPSLMQSMRQVMYDADGRLHYKMHSDSLAYYVQMAVDAVRLQGADYVVLLSHLAERDEQWTSVDLIHRTRGIDVVLDAHSHSVIADSIVLNARRQPVHLTQTGTLFANVGKLWIGPNGEIETSLIPTESISEHDSLTAAVTDRYTLLNDSVTSVTVGYSDFELVSKNQMGQEVIRVSETNLGDLTADALLYCTGAQIAISNAGGMRHSIPAGDITHGTLLFSLPYLNAPALLRMQGSSIVTFLSETCKHMPQASGLFPQVAGLKFTIDLISSATPQITEVMVLDAKTQKYAPLDPSRYYQVAVNNYYVMLYPNIFGSCQALSYGEPLYYSECVRRYIVEGMRGKVSLKYAQPQDRIKVKFYRLQ